MDRSRFRFAANLENSLGDPRNPAAPISFERAMDFDEREELPAAFLAVLHRHGVHRLLIPLELGGRLKSFEESMLAMRIVARRDLTAAIAFGQTFLGAIPIWLAGGESQKRALAACIRDGELGCLALTEEEHGGDLLACEFRADAAGGGYRLSGRKWLINNGSRGGTATVFARTAAESGLSAFSLFFLEKRALSDLAAFHPLDKVRTLGIRGADIGGFECTGLAVPDSAIVGARGRGYEIVLKTLQVSRTLCAALSLGAADTALRAAVDFAMHRKVFGGPVAEIPAPRDQLTGAYADLLVCECLSIVASRALQCSPDRMAVWSSIVKYLVPTMVEELISESARVLGARYYLRQSHCSGVFQKCLRDNAVVSLFDGSTAVNIHIVAGQLQALANRRRTVGADAGTERDARLRDLCGVAAELQWKGFPSDSDLKFTNNGCDEIVEGLVAAVRRGAFSSPVRNLAQDLADELDRLDAAAAGLQGPRDTRSGSAARFALAKRYCLIFAGAACLMLWLGGRGVDGAFFDGTDWIVVCLHRLLARLRPNLPTAPAANASEAVFERLAGQHDRNELFSLFELPLGTGTGV